MTKADLQLDPVLDAIAVLEANLRLIRTWGRCGLCNKKSRVVLTLA